MHPDFWHERWREERIGFHSPAVQDGLRRHWAGLGVASDSRVFVPLCGKSLDLLWLRDQGHEVVGVELSEIAVEAFCRENGIAAKRQRCDPFQRFEASRLVVLCGDFFALTAAALGGVRAVYDRAGLVSWAPHLRRTYAEHMTAMTAAGTQTLLVSLEYSAAEMAGPPFPVDRNELDRLYSSHHEIRELGRQDVLSTEPRMRQRGVTSLFEVCYSLLRLP